MRLAVELTDSEAFALQQFAARQVAGVDERSLVASIRVIVRERLIMGGFMDRATSEGELVDSGLGWVNTVAAQQPKPAATPAKPPKTRIVELKEPQATFKNKPSLTRKVWLKCIAQCIGVAEPKWYTFTISDIARLSGLSGKQTDSVFRTLANGNWLHAKPNGVDYAFSEPAKDWILKNQKKLLAEIGEA